MGSAQADTVGRCATALDGLLAMAEGDDPRDLPARALEVWGLLSLQFEAQQARPPPARRRVRTVRSHPVWRVWRSQDQRVLVGKMYERWRDIKAERAAPGSCVRTAARMTLAEVSEGRDVKGIRIDPTHVRRAESLVRRGCCYSRGGRANGGARARSCGPRWTSRSAATTLPWSRASPPFARFWSTFRPSRLARRRTTWRELFSMVRCASRARVCRPCVRVCCFRWCAVRRVRVSAVLVFVCVCVYECVVGWGRGESVTAITGNTTVDTDAPVAERRRRAAVRSTMVSLRLVANGVVVDATRPVAMNWPGFTLAARTQLSLRVRRRPTSLVVAVVHARWYRSATVAAIAVPVPGEGAPDHVSAATVGPIEGVFEFAASAPIVNGFWASPPRVAAAAAGGGAVHTVGSAERFTSGVVDIAVRWSEVSGKRGHCSAPGVVSGAHARATRDDRAASRCRLRASRRRTEAARRRARRALAHSRGCRSSGTWIPMTHAIGASPRVFATAARV